MTETRPDILCIGAMLWDFIGRCVARLEQGDDVPGQIAVQPGGVALNVALALARLGLRPAILSAVGRNSPGDLLIARVARKGVDTGWLWRDGGAVTDSYVAIESPAGHFAAIADTRGLEAAGAAILAPLRDGRLGSARAPWRGTIVLDGNLTVSTLTALSRDPCVAGADLRVVPASPDKVTRLWPLLNNPRAIVHLNLAEAEALTSRSFRSAARAAEAVAALGARRVIVTDGANLVADAMRGEPTLTQSPPCTPVLRITGAGDAFLAALFAAERAGGNRAEALALATRAATAHIAGTPLAGTDP